MAVLEFVDEFALEALPAVAEELQRVGLADVAAHDGLLASHQFGHFFLNLLKVGTRERVLARVDVVVESVLDGGTYTKLNAVVEFLQSLGQQVCRCVPEGVLALGILPLEQLDLAVLTNGARDVPRLTIERRCQHVACQASADALGNLQRRDAALKLLDVSVGKLNVNRHNEFYVYI